MLKRWIEIMHLDEHDRQLIELLPQEGTPAAKRYILLFKLQRRMPMPNGEMGMLESDIRYEIKAQDAADAYRKFDKEMKLYGERVRRAEEAKAKKIVVPGPGTMNRLNRLDGVKNGGGLSPG